MMRPFFLVILSMLSIAAPAARAQEASLTGKAGNYTAYFLENERIRHNRYELWLTQKAKYSFRFSSVIETRFRFDAALMDHDGAPLQKISKGVRDDEMTEGEVRQAYFDYLGDSFRMTFGIQKIDWVESLSPLANDILTPLDLRHGGFGDPGDVIVPVGAVALNHKFIGGSLDWLVVPMPKPSRMSKGDNGYGFRQYLRDQIGDDISVVIEEEGIQRGIPDTEVGLRYLMTFDALELTLFGYRGHHRKPVVRVEEIGDEEVLVTMNYPRTNTFGFFGAYAFDGIVMRLMAFHEPRRSPNVVVIPKQVEEDQYQERSRVGIGFDWVISKHLKIYSEQFYTKTTDYPKVDKDGVEGETSDDDDTGLPLFLTLAEEDAKEPDDRNPKTDYTGILRLTNETFKDIELALDGIFQSPNKAHILSPAAKFKFWQNWELGVGARFVRSWHPSSVYEPIENTSHGWVALHRSF
jgi:hypothetical protein